MTARVLVTGVDAEGRSCAVKHDPIAIIGDLSDGGIAYSPLYTAVSNPSIAGNGGRTTDDFDLGVAPGAISWMVVEYAPGMSFSMHHTDTVDLDTVLAGSVEIVLDDGAHALAAGDCVVVTGLDHGWRAGPDGCRISVMAIGASSP
jgi:quercetin dioxygenase-like cupin family protein